MKNRIADAAAKEGLSINRWASGVLLRAAETSEGFPVAPPAAVPLPSPERVLRGLLTGEETLEPCGRPYPCERTGVTILDGMSFCNECRVRVE